MPSPVFLLGLSPFSHWSLGAFCIIESFSTMQIFSLCQSFILLFSLMVSLERDPSQQQSSLRARAQSLAGSVLKGSLKVREQSALRAAGRPLGTLGGQKGHPAGPASLCPVPLN